MTGRDTLRGRVLELIAGGPRGPSGPGAFDCLALDVFAYQFEQNEPYRRFCERRGMSPAVVSHWTEIPAVPTAAFREAVLICGDPADAAAVFCTSGTSGGPERRGRHYVRDLSLYETSALTNFSRHVLPDRARLPMLILGPPPELAPDSSLTWMFEKVRVAYGAQASGYFIGTDGLRFDALLAALEESERGAMPVTILGTASALAHLIEALAGRRLRFALPSGSRLMETGGFKRRGGEVPREEFYARLIDRLGLSELYCVAEYGMTELCSQFYDNVLNERARGRSPQLRYKVVPPWVRTRVLDAETLEPVPTGEIGVLRHFDLANLDSVTAIQTDDLGVAGADGFEILGRAAGAELRGCSLAMDEWLTAQR